jgi:hypothetical protein
MNVVALQNASGHFVAPTQTSVTAAMTDAKAQPDGTLTFNYDDTGNTAAYPMPMVTYAVVPTTPVPAAQAKGLTSFLTSMVAFSSGKDGVLPGGYVPLPSSLATQATQDIAKDIVAGTPTSTGPSGPGGSTGTTTVTSPSRVSVSSGVSVPMGSSVSGGVAPVTSLGVGVTIAAAPRSSTAPGSHPVSTESSGKQAPPPRQKVIAADFNVIVAGTRLLIPVLIAIALAAILVGPILLAWPRRRRPAHVGIAGPESHGSDP